MNDKKITLKSATAEIKKYQEQISKKKSRIDNLNQEIKECQTNIEKYEKIIEKLNREQLQKKIETICLRESISIEQLTKIIDVGTQLKDKIDNLSIDDIITAIDMVYDDKKDNSNSKMGIEDGKHIK